jgi:hypothetical protein
VVKRATPNTSVILDSVYRGALAFACWLLVELYRDLRTDLAAIKALVESDRVTISAIKAIQETHGERINNLETKQWGKP